jgi:D-sedoheptulose 7-phosphate isomerase
MLESIEKMIQDSLATKQKVLEDKSLHQKIAEVTQLIVDAMNHGKKVLIAGNGGSAADAQHIAAEFVSRFEFDRPGLPAIALTTDTSALTAIGNDYGYEKVFSRQIQALGQAGDIFIGITTSGNSKNVLLGIEAAQAKGITCVALCGQGGKIHDMVDYVLAAPSTHTPRIQESHILIAHMVCALVEEAIFAEYKPRH